MKLQATGIFIFVGFDDLRKEEGKAWHLWLGREIAINRIAYVADAVDNWLEVNPPEEYPSNFDVDVLEHMGSWFYRNYGATTLEIEAELAKRMELFEVKNG